MKNNKEVVTVTYGEEKFFPAKYNGFTVGPYTYTSAIQEGETPKQAISRVYKELSQMADQMFEHKYKKFMEKLTKLP